MAPSYGFYVPIYNSLLYSIIYISLFFTTCHLYSLSLPNLTHTGGGIFSIQHPKRLELGDLVSIQSLNYTSLRTNNMNFLLLLLNFKYFYNWGKGYYDMLATVLI
eukprot:snap_masked-scaffold_9-processed-gene-1.5-mRNA-1 protein AED:1.00 eAED:1.00 QI:0/0/0/0/1/1/2/0/104